MGRATVLGLVITLTLVPSFASAQDAAALRQELEAMRHQFEAMKDQYQKAMDGLNERLRRLEAEPQAQPSPPVAQPIQPSPAPTGSTDVLDLLRPRQPFALGQPGRGLLFDMGVAGDFIADFTSARQERLRDGTFNGRENRVFPRHIELALFGRVDPYASASIRFTAAEEAPAPGSRRESEIAVQLEEANATIFTLPLGTTLRFGLMAPRFGTLNQVHEDDLPQVDRPDVLRRFFGQEELNAEKGLEAFWVLPTPFYQEVAVGVFNGDNDVAFGHGSLRDPLVLGRLRNFFELGERGGGLQVDLSAASGVTQDDLRNTVAALGIKYKWSPLVGVAFPVVTLAGEAIFGRREVAFDDAASTRHLERWGYYVYGQYDWTRRWAAGLRYDWTELPTSSGREWALSPYLQFKPSEFLRFRAQFKHTEGRGPLTEVPREANEFFLQGTFIIGAHPVERF